MRVRTVSSPPEPPRRMRIMQGDLGIDASYEVDFWGKNHDKAEAAKQTAVAAAYDQQVISLAVTSSVAMTYFQALGAAGPDYGGAE